MEYQFMQIYGNCAATHYLGDKRIRGPVDNVITKSNKCIELLLNNKYVDYIKKTSPKLAKRNPNFSGDSEISYIYDLVEVVHQDPRTTKYLTELKNRQNNFNEFLQNINKDNYYFVYSLNIYELDNSTHSLKANRFETNIKYLKEHKLLDKTIFVGTVGTNWWNFWSNDIIKYILKYNLKYIEITNVGIGHCDNTDATQQFNKKVIDVINNGTDKKYLLQRNLKGDYMKYVIMCGGNYKNFIDLPKHFIKVKGEPIINRTIRLLKENGIAEDNIIITSNNPIFNQCGVTVIGDSNNNFTQDAPWTNMKGYWLDAFYPFNEPVCYLFGDVFYSKKAIITIINSKTDYILFFGSDPDRNKNGINMKPWEEPLCFKVTNQQKFRAAITAVKELFDNGKVNRHPIAWELYRYLNNYDINVKKLDKNFICINDISTDVDKPADSLFIEDMLRKYGEDLIKPTPARIAYKTKAVKSKHKSNADNNYLYF